MAKANVGRASCGSGEQNDPVSSDPSSDDPKYCDEAGIMAIRSAYNKRHDLDAKTMRSICDQALFLLRENAELKKQVCNMREYLTGWIGMPK